MKIIRRRISRLYVPTLGMILVLLFLVLPDLQPSVAEIIPVVAMFDADQSAGEPSTVFGETSRAGQVELVDGGTQFLTVGSTVKTDQGAIPDQDVYQAVLTSADFETALAQLGDKGRPVIQFTLTPAGDARLADHTAELRGYYLCLVVDSRVVNCPILRTPLTDRQGVIELTGDATLDDARTLAMLLSSGPAPVPLKLTGD